MRTSASIRGRTRSPSGGIHRDERVDLLVDAHGAELGGEGGPGPPRHDDARHQASHLAGGGDGHEIGHVDLRPEAPQLHRPHEGEDETDQGADEGHDRQGPGPALVDHAEESARRKVAWPRTSRTKASVRVTHEADPGERGRPQGEERQPDPREPGRGHSGPARPLLGNRAGEGDETIDARRKPLPVHPETRTFRPPDDLHHEGDERGVPGADVPRLEHDPAGAGGAGQRPLEVVRRREAVAERPGAPEADPERVGGRAVRFSRQP